MPMDYLGLVGLLKDFVARIERSQSNDHPLAIRHVVEIHPKIKPEVFCFSFKHFFKRGPRGRGHAVLVDDQFVLPHVRLFCSNRNEDFASADLKMECLVDFEKLPCLNTRS